MNRAIAFVALPGLAGALLGSLPRPALAQAGPGSVSTETLEIGRPALGSADLPAPEAAIVLLAGERIAVRVENGVRADEPDAGPVPVGEAAPGEVVARFGAGRWFAWPREPVVWTAPRPGELVFALNGGPEHRLEGEAEVVVARLGPPGLAPPGGFPPPRISLERVAGGVEARYADTAGFGLDLKTLRFVVTTSRGVRYHLASWAQAGAIATVLPLPPPEIPLPPGIHILAATITDRIGNDAPPATIVFDAAQ